MSEIRVNNILNAAGDDAPTFTKGFSVATGMGITGGGNVVATAGTFSGAVNIDDTTDSTSATTGALIVDGGLGVAKNVYIGAGLSVAGTLTYEDVTNVDSVGLITAKSGVNVTGGQLQVGVAYSVGAAGVATAAGFVGPLTGNADTATTATNVTVADESSDTTCFPTFVTAATGNLPPKSGSNLTFNSSSGLLSATLLAGTLQTATQSNITEVGTLGALTVSGAGEFKVGTAVTIASTSGVSTFGANVRFTGDSGYNATWNRGNGAFELEDNAKVKIGSGADLSLYHDGTNSRIHNTTGDLVFRTSGNFGFYNSGGTETLATFNVDGAVSLYHNDSAKFATTNDGVSITGMTTTSAGMTFNGMLKEEVNIVANKLSAGTNIDVADGMVHYYTTNETGTATPNIRFNSSYTLNNKMATGQTVTVTIIYKPNNAGYYAQLQVDGSNVTEYWNGDNAPSSANSAGIDVLTHTITKTANATFLVLSNVQNYVS